MWGVGGGKGGICVIVIDFRGMDATASSNYEDHEKNLNDKLLLQYDSIEIFLSISISLKRWRIGITSIRRVKLMACLRSAQMFVTQELTRQFLMHLGGSEIDQNSTFV